MIVQPAPGGKNGTVSGETVQLTDRLARTLLTYELALKKLDQRERSLKLAEQKWEKQAAKKVEVAGDKWGEEAEERGDFDHTEKIAAMRKAYFKDVDDLLASGTLIIPEA